MSSLNPAPRVSPGLAVRSYSALLAGAREAAPTVAYDERGYAPCWKENLAGGLPVSDIARDLAAGAGKELDGKLCPAHSSARGMGFHADLEKYWAAETLGWRVFRPASGTMLTPSCLKPIILP
jgi:hypothetical protein